MREQRLPRGPGTRCFMPCSWRLRCRSGSWNVHQLLLRCRSALPGMPMSWYSSARSLRPPHANQELRPFCGVWKGGRNLSGRKACSRHGRESNPRRLGASCRIAHPTWRRTRTARIMKRPASSSGRCSCRQRLGPSRPRTSPTMRTATTIATQMAMGRTSSILRSCFLSVTTSMIWATTSMRPCKRAGPRTAGARNGTRPLTTTSSRWTSRRCRWRRTKRMPRQLRR
mmetsp:Transcript_15430/g.50366  ORF Transcript_15430/g.50366 Transcript_15430/m.50366 type:complete len:227 (-) Transcript_15430:969-1649(-)